MDLTGVFVVYKNPTENGKQRPATLPQNHLARPFNHTVNHDSRFRIILSGAGVGVFVYYFREGFVEKQRP